MLSGLLCLMPYSILSILISDPATLHAFPVRFSDPDKLGWVVCLGFCWLVGFILIWGFSAFSLAFFLCGKALNSMDNLKDWCKGVLCSGLCSGSLLSHF